MLIHTVCVRGTPLKKSQYLLFKHVIVAQWKKHVEAAAIVYQEAVFVVHHETVVLTNRLWYITKIL